MVYELCHDENFNPAILSNAEANEPGGPLNFRYGHLDMDKRPKLPTNFIHIHQPRLTLRPEAGDEKYKTLI